MLLPNVLDATIPVVAFLNKLGTTGITIAFVIVSCILKLDGKAALDFKQVSAKHVQWNVLMLVIVAIMMSSALTADATGIKPLIMSVLTPILGGHSMWITGCLMMLVGFILTNVANNFVCAMVMLPLFGTFAAETAMDPVTAAAIACASIVCLYMAFLTPAASPYAGMLFSNTEWFTPADIMKFAVPFSVLLLAAFFFIGYPVAIFLFGLVV
jgi:sodium-dependent dicarboxylate transporter 2/3/5